MLLAKMADSVDAAKLPDGLPAYAGYVDGAYPSFSAICRRFYPHAHCLSITTGYGNARIIDVEPEDAEPENAAEWLVDRVPAYAGGRWSTSFGHAHNIEAQWRPGPYIREGDVSQFLAVLESIAPKLARSAFVIWGAHWTGQLPPSLPPGFDALQCIGGETLAYDLSVCGPRFLAAT